MPNLKISELPAATTPLAGTETVPVVQGGVTEKVSVADLTAGRTVAASSLAVGASLSATDRITLGGSLVQSANVAVGSAVRASSATVTSMTGFYSAMSAENSATITNVHGFSVNGTGLGTGSSITTHNGVTVFSNNTSATNNRAFTASIPSAAGRYNFYADGTADNYFAGKVQSADLVMPGQAAPTVKSAGGTLTGAELITGILQYNGAAATTNIPTGANIEAAMTWTANNVSLDWFVINTGSGLATIGANGNSSLGGLTVAAGASAHFRIRRTAPSTFTIYRLV